MALIHKLKMEKRKLYANSYSYETCITLTSKPDRDIGWKIPDQPFLLIQIQNPKHIINIKNLVIYKKDNASKQNLVYWFIPETENWLKI